MPEGTRTGNVERRVRKLLDEVRVIDPHCHLDPHRPAASNLADIVLYHHVWIELVAAGMDAALVTRSGLPHELAPSDMDPVQRVELAAPYLSRIANTTVGVMLRRLREDLYDHRGPLTAADIEPLAEKVASLGRDPGRVEDVLGKKCNIDRCITVEGEESGMILCGSEALRWLNVADGKTSPLARLEAMESHGDRPLRRASDFEGYARDLVRRNVTPRTAFMGAWLPAALSADGSSDRDVTAALAKIRRGETLEPTEAGGITYFGFRAALEELRQTGIRAVQVIVGAEVLPPHRSITAWHPAFCGSLSRVAADFEDLRFNLSTASDHYTQDIAIMAKHIPNVSVAGYWWHTLYPHTIRKSLELRLDAVPAEKIVAYFSDAYHCEWCYPKLLLVKEILGDILVERVERGWYDWETVAGIVPAVFHDSSAAIYGLSSP